MLFFTKKTRDELQRISIEDSLPYLQSKKEDYRSKKHLIERHIVAVEETVKQLKTEKREQKAHLNRLIAEEDAAIASEEQRKISLKEAFEDLSIDSYMIRNSLLSYSPLETYLHSVSEVKEKISQLNAKINQLETTLATLRQEKSAFRDALKAINSFIESKKEETRFSELETSP